MTQILLIGDSLIAENDWQKRMGSHRVQNFGLPGATAYDILDMLSDIKKQTKLVEIVMVMAGTNDLLSDNYQFIQTLKKIVIQLRKDYPIAEILVSGLFPMNLSYLPDNAITSFNTHIEELTRQTGCCYLDTHDKFLNSEAVIFQSDGVHITPAAYEIWARTLLEHIAFLIEND